MSKPIRIQRKRTKGWRMPENTVYVGRPSKWANPFKIGEPFVRPRMGFCGNQISGTVVDAEHAVELFKRFTSRETAFLISLEPLRGKNLACWCSLDKPCHADILIKLSNKRTKHE